MAHRSLSDPLGGRNPFAPSAPPLSNPPNPNHQANLRRFDMLVNNPSLRPRDVMNIPRSDLFSTTPNQQQPSIIPIVLQNDNDSRVRELQSRLAGVERENKQLEEEIKNALILENPRLLQAFYPIGRPTYNPRTLLKTLVENELDKARHASTLFSKLRDVYGEDAATKYLERSLKRIANETSYKYAPPIFEEGEKKRSPSRKRSKSPKKKPAKSSKKKPAKKSTKK
jgi:hypothetical protein